MVIQSVFFVIVGMICCTVVKSVRREHEGQVIGWAPADEGLNIDFYRQIDFYIAGTPLPTGFTFPNFRVLCKVYYQNYRTNRYEYMYRMDLFSIDNKVRFESLITNSCDSMKVHFSIGVKKEGLQAPPNSELVFMDNNGHCYERSYQIGITSYYTATVKRSALKPVDCPKDMSEGFGTHQTQEGIVMEWTPEGKELIMDFTKNSDTQKIVSVIKYNDNSKLECREVTYKEEPWFLGIVFMREPSKNMLLVLDRVLLKTCEENTLKKTFFVGFEDGKYYTEFKTVQHLCYKRFYTTKNFEDKTQYHYAVLIREEPTKLDHCPPTKKI